MSVATASACPTTESYLGKSYGDMIEDDVVIHDDGRVTGTIKHIDDYAAAFPSTPDGYFFPVRLGEKYAGQSIKVQRTSGSPGTEKSSTDRDWVLRLSDNQQTTYTFKDESGSLIMTLSFAGATLNPAG